LLVSSFTIAPTPTMVMMMTLVVLLLALLLGSQAVDSLTGNNLVIKRSPSERGVIKVEPRVGYEYLVWMSFFAQTVKTATGQSAVINLNWNVCGYTTTSVGCFALGNLDKNGSMGFGNICSVVGDGNGEMMYVVDCYNTKYNSPIVAVYKQYLGDGDPHKSATILVGVVPLKDLTNSYEASVEIREMSKTIIVMWSTSMYAYLILKDNDKWSDQNVIKPIQKWNCIPWNDRTKAVLSNNYNMFSLDDDVGCSTLYLSDGTSEEYTGSSFFPGPVPLSLPLVVN